MQQIHDTSIRTFASDNYAGVHPAVLAAIASANEGHVVSYGADPYTARLQEVVREHLGEQAEAFPVFNGTGANVLALQSSLPRWGAVICATGAHIDVDEGGAPERVGGVKLLAVPTPDGKLTPELVDREAWGFGDEHRAQPGVVSITQSTEVGTLYAIDEIRALADHAHSLGMLLHVDGARIANAAAALDAPLRAFLTDAGVDILSLGGTKDGALAAEAVVTLSERAGTGLTYLRKLDMQLASKMRFLSAQLLALYDGGVWLENARHANAMATRLRAALEGVDDVAFVQPTQSNGVFAHLPAGVADRVRESFVFYDWNGTSGEVRWMCSWDTTESDVDAFAAAVRAAAASA